MRKEITVGAICPRRTMADHREINAVNQDFIFAGRKSGENDVHEHE